MTPTAKPARRGATARWRRSNLVLAEKLRGGADQRIPPTFFGVTAAAPIRCQSKWYLHCHWPNVYGMMASHARSWLLLVFGAGMVLGATSAYAI